MKCATVSALVVAVSAGVASAQIMIPDSTNDVVMLFATVTLSDGLPSRFAETRIQG